MFCGCHVNGVLISDLLLVNAQRRQVEPLIFRAKGIPYSDAGAPLLPTFLNVGSFLIYTDTVKSTLRSM